MAPPRTISREKFDQLANAGKEIITESSEPSGLSPDVSLVAGVEQQQPAPSPEPIAPPATPIINVEAPTVNVAAPEVILRPEIIVQAPDVTVQVQPPDMAPIADAMDGFREAILESVGGLAIQQPSIQVQAPDVNVSVDMQPIAAAFVAVGSDIKDLLQQIANRPTGASWKFTITRDAKGDIESMDAVKETNS